MKYYSEELKKFFDTEEQCVSEEQKHREKTEFNKLTRAKLAKAIEIADKEVDEAYEVLKAATSQVDELQKEYDSKVDAIMNPARDKVRKSLKKRADAIKEFNDTYGTYTTAYNGNKALNEYIKVNNLLNHFWNRFYF